MYLTDMDAEQVARQYIATSRVEEAKQLERLTRLFPQDASAYEFIVARAAEVKRLETLTDIHLRYFFG